MANQESQIIYQSAETAGSPNAVLWRKPATVSLGYPAATNFGLVTTGKRPCFVWFRGDLYNIGGYSRPLVRHRVDARWLPSGIRAPDSPLAVVAGAGSGGSPGEAICIITFGHKQGDLLLAESNPSSTVVLPGQTGAGYVWTLQTAGAEARVNKVRGYRSMNGDAFRQVFEVPYGTASVTENVKTNLRTVEAPDGHNLPPFGTSFGEKALARMWYARTSEHPFRLWGSLPGEPQNVPPTNFLDTDDREAITGLAATREAFIIFCAQSAYLLRKTGEGQFDFLLQKLDSAVGCSSHHGIRIIHNKVYFPFEDGPWIYDGGFRFIGSDIRNFWRADYQADRQPFLDSFAIDHREAKQYVLFTPRPLKPTFQGSAPGTVAYVGNYLNSEQSIGGQNAQPDWSIDIYDRVASAAYYSSLSEVLIAWTDGEIRIEDASDADDDDDALLKHLTAVSPHQCFLDEGDDSESAHEFSPLWAYVEAELNDWVVSYLGGDEAAGQQKLPDNSLFWFKKTVAASQSWGPLVVDGTTYMAKAIARSVHFIQSSRVAGRGLTTRFDADSAVGMKIRGYGGMYGPGPTSRPQELMASVPSGDIAVTIEQSAVGAGVWAALPFVFVGGSRDLRLSIVNAGVVAPVYVTVEVVAPSGAVVRQNVRLEAWSDAAPNLTQALTFTFAEVGDHTVNGYAIGTNELRGSGTSTVEVV